MTEREYTHQLQRLIPKPDKGPIKYDLIVFRKEEMFKRVYSDLEDKYSAIGLKRAVLDSWFIESESHDRSCILLTLRMNLK